MAVHVGTCINEAYAPRAIGFLRSLAAQMHGVRRFCVCYGFRPDSSLTAEFPNIEFHYLRGDVPKADCHGCIQHGAWLAAVPEAADDVLVLSDADVRVQRPFLPQELAHFASFSHEHFGIGENSDLWDNLLREYERLEPAVPLQTVQARYGPLLERCFNTGVMVARPSAWRKLCDAFEAEWPTFEPMFRKRAKCQFLISWMLARHGFKINQLDLSIHAHGHFGTPFGCELDSAGRLYYEGKLTVFKHYF